MNLTTKTARRILELRKKDKFHNTMIGHFAVGELMDMKNELKEMIQEGIDEQDETIVADRVERFIQEIESVEKS